MPPIRFWFACLYGFIGGVAGSFGAVQVQLSGTFESVAAYTWLTILFAGLIAAGAAGKAAWPTLP